MVSQRVSWQRPAILGPVVLMGPPVGTAPHGKGESAHPTVPRLAQTFIYLMVVMATARLRQRVQSSPPPPVGRGYGHTKRRPPAATMVINLLMPERPR